MYMTAFLAIGLVVIELDFAAKFRDTAGPNRTRVRENARGSHRLGASTFVG